VIVLAVDRPEDGATIVTVLPITHSAPTRSGATVDDQRSWVVVDEGNEFQWPGYDLRKVPRKDRYDYGFLPPRFFNQVLSAFLALHPGGKHLTPRD
jgi:hypothetical protein